MKQQGVKKELAGLAVYAVILLAVVYLFLHYVGQRTTVSGNSMYPALEDGDSLVVDKLSYRFRTPERFEIVVFPFQYKDNTYYIKRVIGLPGETVQIVDGKIYINGEVLKEDYGYETIENPGLAYKPITLGEDEYFVLGDNRNDSMDSREPAVGSVKGKTIMGRAVARIWPIGTAGSLQ